MKPPLKVLLTRYRPVNVGGAGGAADTCGASETRGLGVTEGDPGGAAVALDADDVGTAEVDEGVGVGDTDGGRVPPVESADAEPVGDADSQGGVGIGAPTSSPRGTSESSERPR
ncbi:hypothetical protein [Micromonospora avicenniae]|uniref:hypothetical protein n=1 Tax=Micromonospora avicenniae TaxID=1198245 RepID=UPI00332E40CF